MSVTIESPRAPYLSPRSRGINWEKWGWLYMRVSGVVLVVLIFGHLFVNLMLGTGVHQIDFAFVGGKWSDPFWQWWDTLMLWLALIHGANGMRTIVNDYVRKPLIARLLKGALAASAVILIILGTLVAFTFDPCPEGASADRLPALCMDK